jgi:cofilin
MTVEDLVKSLKNGALTTLDLSTMEKEGKLSKSDRRKTIKLYKKESAMTPRQVQRQEVKAKKSLPKISKDERRRKYVDSILDSERDAQAANFTICLGCRKRGHFLKDCPNVVKNTLHEAEVCFNCGETDHPLRKCPQPRNGNVLPFAKCFICKKTGHISKECPENAHGLYPKGGCCHICLQKTHLVRDCPERTEEDKEKYRLIREAAQDKQLGPRIKGLSESDVTGGDDMVEYEVEEEAVVDEEDDDEFSTKKRKKSVKSSSKKSKRQREESD